MLTKATGRFSRKGWQNRIAGVARTEACTVPGSCDDCDIQLCFCILAAVSLSTSMINALFCKRRVVGPDVLMAA